MDDAMTTPPPPPPFRRMAPRPLALHLTAAAATLFASPGALPNSKPGSPLSKRLAAADPGLAAALASADPDALAAALRHEILARAASFADGIARYRAHPWRRPVPPWPEIWREGTTRLLDGAPGGDGAPVLLVPSLVNRAHILDLLPERSFLRALAQAGLRPMLVDWDRPGATERGWGLEDYIAGRLARCLDHVVAVTGRRPVLLGYCMGGLLALPLALQRAAGLAGLVLLATPWDFHAERPDLARALAALARHWLPGADLAGELPVDAIQSLFAALDPLLALRKYVAFAGAGEAAARDFVALEDWLNDGVPLAARVARECLLGWYGDNATARGEWRIGGRVVAPGELALPALVVVPAQDRIVPPPTALPLAASIPGAASMVPPLGHVGMMASARAPSLLWSGLAGWIRAHAAS